MIDVLILIAGIALLVFGGNWLVDSSGSIAVGFGVRQAVIGMSLVAFGTSLPEFAFNVQAAIKDSDAMGLGNILGSNIANFALVLGVTALVKPLEFELKAYKNDYLFVLGITAVFVVLSLDSLVSAWDGVILAVLFITFLAYLLKSGKIDEPEVDSESPSLILLFLKGFVGLVLLIIGGYLMVDSGSKVALMMGVPELVIGISMIAIGTSLPELAASIASARKGNSGLVLGNVIGSNVFNILFVIGLISIVDPTPTDGGNALHLHFPALSVITLAILPIMLFMKSINRIHGSLLLLFYAAYVYVSFV